MSICYLFARDWDISPFFSVAVGGTVIYVEQDILLYITTLEHNSNCLRPYPGDISSRTCMIFAIERPCKTDEIYWVLGGTPNVFALRHYAAFDIVTRWIYYNIAQKTT